MKLKILAIACILILPLGLIYAQGNSGSPPGHASPPGHDGTHGGHVGNGNGHEKFNCSPD
jgi:hypothetical protein